MNIKKRKNNDYLTIFSSYSRDKIIDKDGKVTTKRGGPLFFIENVLREIHVPYKSFYGPTINVEIKVGKNGEAGKVLGLPTVNSLPKSNISSYILVSTIFNEWNLDEISKLNAKVFVDIQGFVRQVDRPGKKRTFKYIEKYAEKIYCLKGTREEMSFIPKTVYEEQKKRLLIITDEDRGTEYFFEGKRSFTKVMKKIDSKDTVGVGDTFFGYFVGLLFKGKTLKSALGLAMNKSANFLQLKT